MEHKFLFIFVLAEWTWFRRKGRQPAKEVHLIVGQFHVHKKGRRFPWLVCMGGEGRSVSCGKGRLVRLTSWSCCCMSCPSNCSDDTFVTSGKKWQFSASFLVQWRPVNTWMNRSSLAWSTHELRFDDAITNPKWGTLMDGLAYKQ